MFEYGIVSVIFGNKRNNVAGEWRKLHNEELKNLYSVRYIVRVIKRIRKRWERHVQRMEEMRSAYKIYLWSL
jgi:hypothetical protein